MNFLVSGGGATEPCRLGILLELTILCLAQEEVTNEASQRITKQTGIIHGCERRLRSDPRHAAESCVPIACISQYVLIQTYGQTSIAALPLMK